MGQASVALPDPLSAAPVNPGNTDDLLAQLAGEEIERLLAEADEPSSQKAVDTTAASPIAPPPANLVSTASPAPESSSPGQVAKTSFASAPADPEDLELNALFTQLESPAPPAPVAKLPVSASAPAPDAEPSAADALAQEMLEDSAVSGGAALKSDAAPAPAFEAPEQFRDSPVYIRLLEWVNRPLTCCSDQTRDLVGKIAILTTVNAAAVLAYVIIFRGH